MSDLLSVARFAERAGVSRNTVYREVRAGRLPVRRFGSSGMIRIPESALLAAFEPPPAPASRPTRDGPTTDFLGEYKRRLGLS